MKKIFFVVFALVSLTVKSQTTNSCTGEDACCKKPAKKTLTCKLTTPELRLRKETVIKSLKSQITEKKELKDGFQYSFAATDKMIDELAEFIKTERTCCDFFTFNLSFKDDQAILQIKGPKGAKEFIKNELDM